MRGSAISCSTARAGHQQRAEQALPAGPRVAEDLLDGQRRSRGTFEACLSTAAVAGHQRRRGEAEHLPEREVPGHDRQHDAQRLEGDVALGGVGLDVLVGQEARGVLGVEVAVPGALLDFGFGFDDRLAHLRRGQRRPRALPLAQHRAAACRRSARSANEVVRQVINVSWTAATPRRFAGARILQTLPEPPRWPD